MFLPAFLIAELKGTHLNCVPSLNNNSVLISLCSCSVLLYLICDLSVSFYRILNFYNKDFLK